MKSYDFVIIGGGIVGLTVARELALRKLGTVCVLEKEDSVGMHASGRNSGVVHAGIYYSPDSLKAKFCANGAKKMIDYARDKSIRCEQVGKVIVAQRAEDVGILKKLHARALHNGVRSEWVGEADLKKIEPMARTVDYAIFSPSTAIIDSKAVLQSLLTDLEKVNVPVFKNSPALALNGRVIDTPSDKIEFGHLINAAGLHADVIAHKMGVGRDYQILPFKGIYAKLETEISAKISKLIYPAPDLRFPFLGVHVTKTVDGYATIGPTAIPALGRENYGLLKGIDAGAFRMAGCLMRMAAQNTNNFRPMVRNEVGYFLKDNLLKAAQSLAPALKKTDILASSKVGIRAQLVKKKTLQFVMDFLIEEGPHSTHILNAVSPAFTCSFAFAEEVVDQITKKKEVVV